MTRRKRLKRFSRNIILAGIIGLGAIFTWFIVQGTLTILPTISGELMIGIGVVGLAVLGFLGWRAIS